MFQRESAHQVGPAARASAVSQPRRRRESRCRNEDEHKMDSNFREEKRGRGNRVWGEVLISFLQTCFPTTVHGDYILLPRVSTLRATHFTLHIYLSRFLYTKTPQRDYASFSCSSSVVIACDMTLPPAGAQACPQAGAKGNLVRRTS